MNTIKRLIVVLGIIIIPLLYSYLYLGAFWDPYSRLDTLPIAVVNEDQGAQIHDKSRNLGVALKYCLGLTVKNTGLYFLACGLYSLVAVSIIQFFMVNFKDLGKFLCIVILILQLTACGGTFPMETIPKFFNVIYPFMPMTYSVGLFKEAISGGDTVLIARNAGILAAIAVGFTALSIVLSSVSRSRDRRLEQKNSGKPVKA